MSENTELGLQADAELQPSYFIVIPGRVFYDPTLSDGARLLYGQIGSLCRKEGYCWATNAYFAEKRGVARDTIRRWVKELTDAGHIVSKIDKRAGNTRGLYLVEALSVKIRRASTENSVEPSLSKDKDFNNKNLTQRARARACEEIWQAYPKHAGKPAALKAIGRAIAREGFEKILRLTKAFAKIRPDKRDPYTPWPQRWFNEARYNDDRSTWEPRKGRDGKPDEPSAARKLWLELHPEDKPERH